MDTVCKEFRDHHRQYTGPGEYCTIEFIWFQLKKYDPLVFKTIKIIKVLFETSKFCILAYECHYSQCKMTRNSAKQRQEKKKNVSFLAIENDIRNSSALFKTAMDLCKKVYFG